MDPITPKMKAVPKLTWNYYISQRNKRMKEEWYKICIVREPTNTPTILHSTSGLIYYSSSPFIRKNWLIIVGG